MEIPIVYATNWESAPHRPADTEQTDLRLAYRRPDLELSAGISNVDAARSVQALGTGGTRQILFPIDYNAESSFYDFVAHWRLSDRLALGGSLRSYDNRGSFSLERDDNRVFVDFLMTADYTLQVSYRDIDFMEASFDAYDAKLLELAVCLSW